MEKKTEETENQYAVDVKLLGRFHALYTKGRKENNAPQNYIDFFEAQHFLLIEVEKALTSHHQPTLEKVREEERERIRNLIINEAKKSTGGDQKEFIARNGFAVDVLEALSDTQEKIKAIFKKWGV